MGNVTGRLCFFYQIDLSEDILSYWYETKEGRFSGEVYNEEEFNQAIQEILDAYKTDKIEVALKRFKIVGQKVTGICAKSFPRTDLTRQLLSMINLCVGGASATEIMQLPYEGTILQQPNVFVEAYYIFVDEYNRFIKMKTPKDAKTH